jgi:glycine dehydrogenase
MARRLSKSTSDRFVVHHDTHPQTIAVLATRAEPVGIELVVGDVDDIEVDADGAGCFGALFSLPTSSGAVVDWTDAIARVKAQGGLAVVATDLLACVLMAPPGTAGRRHRDRLGAALRRADGVRRPARGVHRGRDSVARALPGRIVGVSVDTVGRACAAARAADPRAAHPPREGHLEHLHGRRCCWPTSPRLYASWHGPDGLRRIAERTHRLHVLARAVCAPAAAGAVTTPGSTRCIDRGTRSACPRRERAREAGSTCGERHRRRDHVRRDVRPARPSTTVLSMLDGRHTASTSPSVSLDGCAPRSPRGRDPHTSGVPCAITASTEMLRYLRRLADRDLALDRTMIPLGSCTMKLNATAEMMPITWPEFAGVHPFAPDRHRRSATGRSSVELEAMARRHHRLRRRQPAAQRRQRRASSPGCSRSAPTTAFPRRRARTVCLIPSSAHGTNAASAVMAGMRRGGRRCDEHGNVDVDDLRAKVDEHARHARSHHGHLPVDARRVRGAHPEICEHRARRGRAGVRRRREPERTGRPRRRPGRFGADVSHLNLHKTFCIPHGGGGPGVGPVAVRAHLAPFLPGRIPLADGGPGGTGPVSSARRTARRHPADLVGVHAR